MRLLSILALLVASVATVLAAPTDNAPSAPANNGTELVARQSEHYGMACANANWEIPCERFDTVPGGGGHCQPIKPGSVTSRAKSFLLPASKRFPAWECRFFTRGDCTGMDSCQVLDNRRDSGCRYTYSSYWCIDILRKGSEA